MRACVWQFVTSRSSILFPVHRYKHDARIKVEKRRVGGGRGDGGSWTESLLTVGFLTVSLHTGEEGRVLGVVNGHACAPLPTPPPRHSNRDFNPAIGGRRGGWRGYYK